MFCSFNWFFDKIEDIEKELKKNKQEKTELLQTLAVTKKKLMIYYEKTSDVDIEQFFNIARNVCHYHQNHLNADTIEIIILLKWYEKLKLATAE